MSQGQTAMLLGISAGFITLIGLYLCLVAGEPAIGGAMFAIAGSQLALIPARRAAGCARGR